MADDTLIPPDDATIEPQPVVHPTLQKIEVSGESIVQVMNERLGPAIDGLPIPLAVMSLLAACCFILKPDASTDTIERTITTTSQHLMLSLADLPHSQVN